MGREDGGREKGELNFRWNASHCEMHKLVIFTFEEDV